MSASTTKPASNASHENVLRSAHNEVDASITVNGFLVGKVGHNIQVTTGTTTVLNDTAIYTFKDGSTTLYVLTLVYTDASQAVLISATRTA